MVRTRLTALLGAVIVAGALWAATPPLLAQADLPAESKLQTKPWHTTFRERWQGLTGEQRADLQAARAELLDAQLEYMQRLVQLGLLPEEAAAARIQRISTQKRWQELSQEERARLQAARNEILDAQIAYLRELVELGLISQEAAEARIQRLTAQKEAPAGLDSCHRLRPGSPRDARFHWGLPGRGWRSRMGRAW